MMTASHHCRAPPHIQATKHIVHHQDHLINRPQPTLHPPACQRRQTTTPFPGQAYSLLARLPRENQNLDLLLHLSLVRPSSPNHTMNLFHGRPNPLTFVPHRPAPQLQTLPCYTITRRAHHRSSIFGTRGTYGLRGALACSHGRVLVL